MDNIRFVLALPYLIPMSLGPATTIVLVAVVVMFGAGIVIGLSI